MTHQDWDEYRRPDGTINLMAVWEACGDPACRSSTAMAFLRDVEALQPISSRQAAAIAVVTASHIAQG